MRQCVLVQLSYGSFLGMKLFNTPMYAIRHFNGRINCCIYLDGCLPIGINDASQWQKKWQDKKDHVKKHSYRENQTANAMNMYMYAMCIMFAFIYVSWPLAMSFYWMVTSIIRIIQQLVLHKHMNANKK